jgi:hypothetical protein
MTDHLTLKWGTLKAWQIESPAAKAALKEYLKSGKNSTSAIAQRDTLEQKAALCKLIDALDCETVRLEWTGENVTKGQAKFYVNGHSMKDILDD